MMKITFYLVYTRLVVLESGLDSIFAGLGLENEGTRPYITNGTGRILVIGRLFLW